MNDQDYIELEYTSNMFGSWGVLFFPIFGDHLMEIFHAGLIAFLQTSTDSEGCGFQQPTIVQAHGARGR